MSPRGLLAALLLCAACGRRGGGQADGGQLDAGFVHVPDLHASHLASCDDQGCGSGYEPPLGGDHCATPLACRKYTEAQKRCQYVHNLEHGHAVLAYNCPSGCPELVARLEKEFDDRQSSPTLRRILVTPDPRLTTKLALMVWGWSYSAEAWDDAAAAQLLSHQDSEAPEAGLGCSP